MQPSRTKKLSFVLVCLATLLLAGILSSMIDTNGTIPYQLVQSIYTIYPILLIVSFVMFITTREIKSRFDKTAIVLFIINGVGVLIIVLMVAGIAIAYYRSSN